MLLKSIPVLAVALMLTAPGVTLADETKNGAPANVVTEEADEGDDGMNDEIVTEPAPAEDLSIPEEEEEDEGEY